MKTWSLLSEVNTFCVLSLNLGWSWVSSLYTLAPVSSGLPQTTRTILNIIYSILSSPVKTLTIFFVKFQLKAFQKNWWKIKFEKNYTTSWLTSISSFPIKSKFVIFKKDSFFLVLKHRLEKFLSAKFNFLFVELVSAPWGCLGLSFMGDRTNLEHSWFHI